MKTHRLSSALHCLTLGLSLAASIGCTRPVDAQAVEDPAGPEPVLAQPGDRASGDPAASNDRVERISIQAQRAWADPSSPGELIGLGETALGDALGPATTTAWLDLSASSKLYEYQSSLYRVIPKTGSLTVKQLTWKTSARTITVWLQADGDRWVSFDSLAWSDDIRF